MGVEIRTIACFCPPWPQRQFEQHPGIPGAAQSVSKTVENWGPTDCERRTVRVPVWKSV